MNKRILLIIGTLFFVSCSGLKGTYVDMLNAEDTIIIKGDGVFQRRLVMSNGRLLVYDGKYKTEKGSIEFVDWKSDTSSDGRSFTSMELNRPIFRSGGIRLSYNDDLEKGYYERLKSK